MRRCARSISAARSRRRSARPVQPMRATRLLDVRGVSVLYGKAQALDNVSLHVGAGEFVSVVGLNGAGKTTLFNAISGLVPYQRQHRLERHRAARPQRRRRSPAAASCNARKAASCSAT